MSEYQKTAMDFTKIMDMLENATPYELYRLRAALKIAMQDPKRIENIQNGLAINTKTSYFNEKKNSLCHAIILEKNIKYVVVQDLEDHRIWHVPYYAINITGQDSTIYAKKSESLTRNHLALGELVGFMHNGQQIVGNVIKFNPKSVKLLTTDGKNWNVGYGWLFKIIEGNQPQNRGRLIEGISERVS